MGGCAPYRSLVGIFKSSIRIRAFLFPCGAKEPFFNLKFIFSSIRSQILFAVVLELKIKV